LSCFNRSRKFSGDKTPLPVQPAANRVSITVKESKKLPVAAAREKLLDILAEQNVVILDIDGQKTLGFDARVVRNFENGAAHGFKVLSVVPGSAYGQKGLRDGDVVTRIGDESLTDSSFLSTRIHSNASMSMTIERHSKELVIHWPMN
jgi:type II secretory pathway component PulC